MHFYACICAFASDPKLSEEFSYYINLDQTQSSIEKSLATVSPSEEEDKVVGIGEIEYTYISKFILYLLLIII